MQGPLHCHSTMLNTCRAICLPLHVVVGEVQATCEGLGPKGCTSEYAGLTAITPSQPESTLWTCWKRETMNPNSPNPHRPQVPAPSVYEIPNFPVHLPVLTFKSTWCPWRPPASQVPHHIWSFLWWSGVPGDHGDPPHFSTTLPSQIPPSSPGA